MEIPRAHGVEDSDLFLKSPVRLILEGGPPLRRRLARADCPLDFPITQDIKPQGYTAYTARPLPFSTRPIHTLTLAIKPPDCFSHLHIATHAAAMPLVRIFLELPHPSRPNHTSTTTTPR